MNSVQYLLQTDFPLLILEDKCKIKKLGKRLPQLDLKQVQTSQGKTFYRAFNFKIYERNSWICGCESIYL